MTDERSGLFGERKHPPSRPRSERPDPASIAFVHESELLFARLLDFYDIEWAYEPRTFDLATGDGGAVTERFSPDFYLPEYDLYVELTTMSQKLVTRKNRKIRMLRERYPDVQCRIFYQRDIHNLATKLGLQMPSEDFTAT